MTRWFASGGGVTSVDGFSTQAEAYAAYRLTTEARKRQRETTGRDLPFPVDLVVWPEDVDRPVIHHAVEGNLCL